MDTTRLHTKRLLFLLLKLSLLVCSFIYIYLKLSEAFQSREFQPELAEEGLFLLAVTLVLVIFNWGLEALKWQFLLSRFWKIRFFLSLKSVLAGVSISIFTPNRIGEFAARVLFIDTVDKIKASLISLLGSVLQLLVTIITGTAAYLLYTPLTDNTQLNFIETNELALAAFAALLTLVFIFFYSRKKNLPQQLKNLIETLRSFSAGEIGIATLLSFIRYIVFALQFYLVLVALGFEGNAFDIFCMIALTFLVNSAIPTFALTEIAVRSATSIYFLGKISPDPVVITTASILLWIFNLVLPALAGSVFIVKMDLLSKRNEI